MNSEELKKEQLERQKSYEISMTLLTLINNGCPIPQALDAVLGQGTFERLNSEVYEQLRNKK